MSGSKLRVGFFVLFFCLSASLFSAPYKGEHFWLEQPDGSQVEVVIFGDEFFQYVESLDGYSLIRDDQTGWITYAQQNTDGSDFVSTGVVYNHRQPTDPNQPVFAALRQAKGSGWGRPEDKGTALKKKLRLRRDAVLEKVNKRRQELLGGKYEAAAQGDAVYDATILAEPAPLTGSVVGLTLLVDFADQPAVISQAEINNYCNHAGYAGYGNNGSVRDYYYAVSDGKLEYTNYVTSYYRALYNKSYYDDCAGGRTSTLMLEALTWLDAQGFDYQILSRDGSNRIKALNIFYAGSPSCGWAKGLWPHMGWYSGFTSNEGVRTGNYQITNIGTSLRLRTFCHENGHMICGYPDLYDYGYESNGAGNYCLMAYGGNDSNPVPPNPYFRNITGWETIIDVTASQPGTFLQHTANGFTTYRYSHPTNSEEYFLIDSRVKTGRNSSIPDDGLLIWHIDENGSNDNEQMTPSLHYKVSVEQADGAFHLEKSSNYGGSGDLFHAGYKETFDDFTLPNAHWWDGLNSGFTVTQISAVSTQMSFVLGAGSPVGYWKMDGSGNDSSGLGRTLVLNNFPSDNSKWSSDVWKGGLVNLDRCLVFDGVDDFATVAGAADSSGTVSAAFWFRGSAVADSVLIDKFPAGAQGSGWRIWLDSAGRVHFTVGSADNSTDLSTGQPINHPGLWRHLVCTFSNGTAEIIVNGRVVCQATEILQNTASAVPITIGKAGQVPLGGNFAGLLDEVCIYTSILNDVRIKSLPGMAGKEDIGLAGYWMLDEYGGITADDSSSFSRSGSLTGGLSFDTNAVAGRFGRALAFDGVDDYINLSSGVSTPGEGFSVAVWAYPTAAKNWARFIDFGNGAGSDNIVLARNGTGSDMTFQSYNGTSGGSQVTATAAIELNKWQFFAATVDKAGNVRLYKNGTLIKSGVSAGLKNVVRGKCYIGRSNWSSDGYYQGMMDEVRIFDYVLSEQDVISVMEGGRAAEPMPSNSEPAAAAQTILSWKGGLYAQFYAVYSGTNQATVAAATTASPEFMGYRIRPLFNPGGLNENTVHFWRVDQILADGKVLEGNVWNFTTAGAITRQAWTGVTGSLVSNLTASAKYPDNPDTYEYLSTFEGPTDWQDNYGSQMQAYLTPQTSGQYAFWIAGDDNCELWLSSDSNPANRSRIAYVSTWSGSRNWDQFSAQKSGTITLTGGQSYYIMALHKEGGGQDNLAVAWQGPDCPTRSVIQGRWLSPYISKTAPKFSSGELTGPAGLEGLSYTSTIAGGISGQGSFSKLAGPVWLTVDSSGLLSGTPSNGQKGQNVFSVQAKDNFGRTDEAIVRIPVGVSYDGAMGPADLAGFAEQWLTAGVELNSADLDASGDVDMKDLSVFAGKWQSGIVPGLVAYWTMDDAAGGVIRDIYGGIDGTAENMEQWGRTAAGRFGNAVLLDGIDDYVHITGYKGITGSGARTCTAWIKTGTAPDKAVISWGKQETNKKWIFGFLHGQLGAMVQGGNIFCEGSTVTDGKWHHVAVTLADFDNNGSTNINEAKLYIDGIQQAVVSSTGCIVDTASEYDVNIGAYQNESSRTFYFDGMLDDARVYNRALSPDEIAQIAQTGMVAHWPFDSAGGIVAAELAAGREGLLTNMSDSAWTAGKINNCLSFDGVDDLVRAAGYKGITGSGARTCSVWIRTSTAADSSIISWGKQETNKKWIFGFLYGKLGAMVQGGNILCEGSPVMDGKWHHVAVTLADFNSDGSTNIIEAKVYIDGIRQAVTSSTACVVDTASEYDVTIGAYQNDSSPNMYFNGMIDDVRVYNRALSDYEIAEIAG